MEREIFGANLKQNPVSCGESKLSFQYSLINLFNDYASNGIIGDDEGKGIIFFAPFTHLDFLNSLQGIFDMNKWKLGSQGVSQYVSGAHTSEISPMWLRQLGVTDVLIGHSEVRREYEDLISNAIGRDGYRSFVIDSLFNKQMENAFNHNLRVTYCVGETEGEKENGKTLEVLKRQIYFGLRGLNFQDLSDKLIIAYEPRWAIGGGKPIPTFDEIEQVHTQIRGLLRERGYSNPEELRILYGGGMNPDNVKGIMGIKGVNGGLVGSACLDAEKFSKIVNY